MLVVVFCVSVSVGDFPIPLRDVVPAIFGDGEPDAEFIVRTLRLPRALTGMLVGAAFGFSGAVFQSLARNPLASPDIIGISSGASAAAVFCIVVLGVSRRRDGRARRRPRHGVRHVRAGLEAAASRGTASCSWASAWSAFLASITEYLMTRADIYDAQRAAVWLTGSLNGRGWEHVRPIGIADLLLLPASWRSSARCGCCSSATTGEGARRGRRAIAPGARPRGRRPRGAGDGGGGSGRVRGVRRRPIARRLTRAPLAVGCSALVGALVMLLSDLVARRAFAPTELPVGVVTGVIGAPYLLWLLARANRVGRGG